MIGYYRGALMYIKGCDVERVEKTKHDGAEYQKWEGDWDVRRRQTQ